MTSVKMHIMQSTGTVNSIFAVVPMVSRNGDYYGKLEEELKRKLRYDRERGTSIRGVSLENPTLDPLTVSPRFARQQLYRRGFPLQTDKYEIIDAFVCLGSRFGLERIQVYVELCRGASRRYWANIYYIVDDVMPEVVIRVDPYVVELDSDELLAEIEKDRKQEEEDDRRAHLDELEGDGKFAELLEGVLPTIVGGQIQVRNAYEGYLYRGEVESATVVNSEVRIRLKWMAKARDPRSDTVVWVKDDKLDYKASIILYTVYGLGRGVYKMQSHITNEEVLLLPPTSRNRIDPAVVENL